MYKKCPLNFKIKEECCIPVNLVTEEIDTTSLVSTVAVFNSMYTTGLIVTSGLSTRSSYEPVVLSSNVLVITAEEIAKGFTTVCSRTGDAAYNITLPTAPQLAAKELEVHSMPVVAGQRLLPIIIHNNNTVGIATLLGGNGITLFPSAVIIQPGKTATCTLSFTSTTEVAALCSLSA